MATQQYEITTTAKRRRRRTMLLSVHLLFKLLQVKDCIERKRKTTLSGKSLSLVNPFLVHVNDSIPIHQIIYLA
jgi:hypothetical protein